MRNGSSSSCCSSSPVAMGLQQVFSSQATAHGWLYGQLTLLRPVAMQERVMPMPPLLHGLFSLNFLLLVVYLLLFLLAKLFNRLCRARDHGRDNCAEKSSRTEEADIAGGAEPHRADSLFWFDEALLVDEGKDHLSYSSAAAHCLEEVAENCTFPATASTALTSFSPRRDRRCDDVAATTAVDNGRAQRRAKDISMTVTFAVADDVPTSAPGGCRQDIPVAASPENVSVQVSEKPKISGGEDDRDSHEEEEADENKASLPDVKRFVNSNALADTKNLLLPEGGAAVGARLLRPRREEEADGDSSCRFGASTLTSESTSKSSVEWQSSAVAKDAYSDLFSSSSRRSSARWESYTLFRKYDEDMVYFHRVGAQKLTETESFRSIKYQPRSMSQRITHKLTMAPTPPPIGLRDPYPELERVYVAQICLTWEALNWNYTSFRRHNGGGGGGTMTMLEDRCCPARVAQEFQQFQVLLYRFIENEPFEHGRRPEIYARMKNSSPKLLLVPEFREEEDEKDDLISAVQFLHILEESIRTFMAFLRADKRSHYQMFREMVRRRASAADQTIVIALKKANKAKKSRLKDVTRPRRCLKRSKARDDEVVPVLLGLIDLKVVARVLRMPEITDQQLHWCEEKMNRVRVDVRQGKLQRDPSPLFFPAH
ncbi:uncharacterized protein LOC124698166 isoform X2 [Lolium rigidum]|uniref:uncharacterized protein LOC124698166 isoform X2 n=1 Tax=Lolium rigidum TaxID=89674 RepID=UPI001F5C6745|nr:uncharacterized protein LOC124698166 isoform X2 [Lolium rigidum]